MVSLNLPDGGIYDALIAQAALKANIDRLLTLNPNDFVRLGENIASLSTNSNVDITWWSLHFCFVTLFR